MIFRRTLQMSTMERTRTGWNVYPNGTETRTIRMDYHITKYPVWVHVTISGGGVKLEDYMFLNLMAYFGGSATPPQYGMNPWSAHHHNSFGTFSDSELMETFVLLICFVGWNSQFSRTARYKTWNRDQPRIWTNVCSTYGTNRVCGISCRTLSW